MESADGSRHAQVSLSAFAFLFSEMVQYFQGRVQNISDLENRCVRPAARLASPRATC